MELVDSSTTAVVLFVGRGGDGYFSCVGFLLCTNVVRINAVHHVIVCPKPAFQSVSQAATLSQTDDQSVTLSQTDDQSVKGRHGVEKPTKLSFGVKMR